MAVTITSAPASPNPVGNPVIWEWSSDRAAGNGNTILFIQFYDATHTKIVTTSAHGYQVGDVVTISGALTYNGRHVITTIPSTTEFVIEFVWVGDTIGSVVRTNDSFQIRADIRDIAGGSVIVASIRQ